MNQKKNDNFFKEIDLFQYPITFSYNSNNSYKTILGGLLTIIKLFLSIYCAISYIYNLINKKEYIIISKESEKLDTVIDFSNIPFAFKLIDSHGYDIDSNILNFSIYVINNLKLDKDKYELIYKNIEFENCANSTYYDILRKYTNNYNYNFSNFLCIKPNQNIKLYGKYKDEEFGILRIYLNKCKNKINYFPENEAKISFVYLGYDIDYSEKIIGQKLIKHYAKISSYFIKKYYYFYKSANYIINNNLFLNKEKTYNFFEYDNYEFDIEYDNTNSKDYYSYFTFMSNSKEIQYIKKIENIWDYIAKFGGILNIILIITQIINNYIANRLLLLDIYNELNKEIKEVNEINDFNDEIKTPKITNLKYHFNVYKNKKVESFFANKNVLDNSEVSNINKCPEIPKNLNFTYKASIINNNINENKLKSVIDFRCKTPMNNNILSRKRSGFRRKIIQGISINRQIQRNHYLCFSSCPLACIKRSKKYSFLYEIKKDVHKLLSVENFIRLLILDDFIMKKLINKK